MGSRAPGSPAAALKMLQEGTREVLGNPRFPLKGSFKGGIDIDVDIDMDIARRDLNIISKFLLPIILIRS